MAYTAMDWIEQRAGQLESEEGMDKEEAEEKARFLWNEEMTDKERDRFLEHGFEEKEVNDDHHILQKMKIREKEIIENKNSKDFYGDREGVRIIKDSIAIIKDGSIINMKDKVGIIMPQICCFVKDIDSLISFLENVDRFNKGSTNILMDLKKIKKLL